MKGAFYAGFPQTTFFDHICKPYRWRELALLGCILVAVAFDTIFPLGTKFIIDLAIVPGDTAMFVKLVAGLGLLYLITTITNPILDYLDGLADNPIPK